MPCSLACLLLPASSVCSSQNLGVRAGGRASVVPTGLQRQTPAAWRPRRAASWSCLGGGSVAHCYNDVVVLDAKTAEWSAPQTAGTPPHAASGCAEHSRALALARAARATRPCPAGGDTCAASLVPCRPTCKVRLSARVYLNTVSGHPVRTMV